MVVLQIMAEVVDQSEATSSDTRKKGSGIVATAEEQSRRDAMDMRCLSLCIGMLERVNGVRSYRSRSCSKPDTIDVFRPSRRIQPSKEF